MTEATEPSVCNLYLNHTNHDICDIMNIESSKNYVN